MEEVRYQNVGEALSNLTETNLVLPYWTNPNIMIR